MVNLTVVTVVDSVATTSMPINEFVFYRNRKHYGYKEVLLVCDKSTPENVQIPEGVDVHLVGSDKNKIKDLTRTILSDSGRNDCKCVFHLHAQKSAITFLMATIGLGIRNLTLFTVHSTYSHRNLQYKISSCFCTLVSKYANCVSISAYKEYASFVKTVKGRNFIAIPNGVDVSRIKEATRDLPSHKEVAKRNVLVCVGRVIPIKNQEFLIKLLPSLPNCRLILIGSEDKGKKVRETAEKLQVADRVDFKGLVPRDEVFRLLNTCGLYVSSSTVEGLPVSVLEAMCMGLIPILSDINPHNEIANKCNVFKSLPLDSDTWIRNIKEYQEMDMTEFCDLSDRIKESVAENYSLESMHREYNNLYKKIIG